MQYVVYYVHGAHWLILLLVTEWISHTEHIDSRRYMENASFFSPTYFSPLLLLLLLLLLPPVSHLLSLVLLTASEVALLDYADVVIIITIQIALRVGVWSSTASISSSCRTTLVKINISSAMQHTLKSSLNNNITCKFNLGIIQFNIHTDTNIYTHISVGIHGLIAHISIQNIHRQQYEISIIILDIIKITLYANIMGVFILNYIYNRNSIMFH